MKMRSRLLVAVLLSALAACGGDDDDEGDNDDDGPTQDHRSNMTGSYDVTGTMSLTLNGETDTGEVVDGLDIKNDTTSSSKAALRLTVESLGCGPRATMSSERAFTVNATTCSLPASGNGCTNSMKFTQGNGSKPSGGALQASIKGQLVVQCGTASASADFAMEMSGTRTGESLPGTREDALTGAVPSGLRATLDRLAATAQQQ